jgi:death-on-curing protein
VPRDVVFLDLELLEKLCYGLAKGVFDQKDEPIPPFSDHTKALLESALNNPRQTFGSTDLYPTIADKGAILYYSLIKNHPFTNGNKRIATAALLVFLALNGFWLDAGIQEMTQRAIEVANSDRKRHKKIVGIVKLWIEAHLVQGEE